MKEFKVGDKVWAAQFYKNRNYVLWKPFLYLGKGYKEFGWLYWILTLGEVEE